MSATRENIHIDEKGNVNKPSPETTRKGKDVVK